jgi:hypothetical protein
MVVLVQALEPLVVQVVADVGARRLVVAGQEILQAHLRHKAMLVQMVTVQISTVAVAVAVHLL